jgi:hypothetical protein
MWIKSVLGVDFIRVVVGRTGDISHSGAAAVEVAG